MTQTSDLALAFIYMKISKKRHIRKQFRTRVLATAIEPLCQQMWIQTLYKRENTLVLDIENNTKIFCLQPLLKTLKETKCTLQGRKLAL